MMSNQVENSQDTYDVIVIGGGATGLGVAVEAATRGYKTILFEAYDFGKGTSSKSTKLIHGGLRYLANFDFALVKEGLAERHTFLNSAPHITKVQGYLVPFYSIFDKLKYFIGIKLYDFLSGKQKIGKSIFLGKKAILKLAPELKAKSLLGGAVYYDGQFDDTRMLISLLKTFLKHGGTAYNYHEVSGFLKDESFKVTGVKVFDKLNHKTFNIKGKVVINATGVLTDNILDIDEPAAKHRHVTAAQGTHLVFDKEVFDSPHALVIPETSDGRILFVLPWHDKIVVGTTDIAVDKSTIEPSPTESEIDFIIDTLNQYTNRPITKSDIRSVFAGLRPLVKPANSKSTSKISRKHEILLSDSGIVSIVGGKWTIYRLMGEDTINFIVNKGILKSSESISQNLHLFGYTTDKMTYPLSVYGTEVEKVISIQKEINNFNKLHPDLPYFVAEVIYQVRYEMAKTIEDVLARRTRALFLNAKAALESAKLAAEIMAKELNQNEYWIEHQLVSFSEYAKKYIVN